MRREEKEGGVWRKLQCEFDDFYLFIYFGLVGWLKETTKAVAPKEGRKVFLWLSNIHIIKHSSNIYYKLLNEMTNSVLRDFVKQEKRGRTYMTSNDVVLCCLSVVNADDMLCFIENYFDSFNFQQKASVVQRLG